MPIATCPWRTPTAEAIKAALPDGNSELDSLVWEGLAFAGDGATTVTWTCQSTGGAGIKYRGTWCPIFDDAIGTTKRWVYFDPAIGESPEDNGQVSESTEIPDPGISMPDTPIDDGAVESPWPAIDPWGGMRPSDPGSSDTRHPNQTVAFLVHDTTGRILRTGYCSVRDLRAQARAGEIVLEGQANDRLQKVVDGRVVEKTAEEIAATQRQEIPREKQRAFVSQEDWDLFQSRFNTLDERLRKMEQRQPGIADQS